MIVRISSALFAQRRPIGCHLWWPASKQTACGLFHEPHLPDLELGVLAPAVEAREHGRVTCLACRATLEPVKNYGEWHHENCPEIRGQYTSPDQPCSGDYRWVQDGPDAGGLLGFTCREGYQRYLGRPLRTTVEVDRTDLHAVLTQGIVVCAEAADRLRAQMARGSE